MESPLVAALKKQSGNPAIRVGLDNSMQIMPNKKNNCLLQVLSPQTKIAPFKKGLNL